MTFDVKKLALVLAIFVSGIVWFVLMRVIFYQTDASHYHANFAVYLNDQKQEFDSFGFYEEITSCSEEDLFPERRAHMHDNVNDAVHVHDKEVTWGHFFSNIGIVTGDTVIEVSPAQVYEINGSDITYILNGKEVDSINNVVINSEDKLLVYHGSNDDPSQYYQQIGSSADFYNSAADPATCSGDEDLSLRQRFNQVLGF